MTQNVDYARKLLETSNVSAQKNFHALSSSNLATMEADNRPVSAFLNKQGSASQAHLNANDRFFRPQTASVGSLHSNLSPQKLPYHHGHPMTASLSNAEFGIQGYRLPKHGLPPRAPVYSVPKDRLANFLEQTQKRGKELPAPNSYQKFMSWEAHNVAFGKASQRKTFTDEVQKISKSIPSPAQYNPQRKYTVLFGKSNKAQEVDFLSDVAYLGKLNPSPSQYNPDKDRVLARSSSWSIVKPWKQKEKNWRPQKVTTPDVGTYEPTKAVPLTKKVQPKHAFPKSKSLKFTVEYSNNKKYVPGAGSYKIEPCFKKIAIPYMKKRC